MADELVGILAGLELQEATDDIGEYKPGDVIAAPTVESPLPVALSAEGTVRGTRVNLWNTKTGEKVELKRTTARKKVRRGKSKS